MYTREWGKKPAHPVMWLNVHICVCIDINKER